LQDTKKLKMMKAVLVLFINITIFNKLDYQLVMINFMNLKIQLNNSICEKAT